MKLKSDQATIVFLGSFNPRIFHPTWMLRENVLTASESVSALKQRVDDKEGDSSQPALVVTDPVAQFSIGGLNIHAEVNRLVIAATTPDQFFRCLEIATGLQKLLPHSPVKAVGLNRNFVLEVDGPGTWHKIGHAILPKDTFWKANGQEPGTLNASVRYKKCAVKNAQLNLTIGPVMLPGQYLIHVNCNYHFEAAAITDQIETKAIKKIEPLPPTTDYRMSHFDKLLNDSVWQDVIGNAFTIAKRVDKLGSAKG